jgi:hypothetical protein
MGMNLRSMKMWKKILAITGFIAMGACADEMDDNAFFLYRYEADFSDSMDGWWGDFADYPVGINDSTEYELQIEYTDLPANLASGQKALMLSGNNHSDDLFMFIKKKITGLNPSTDYTLAISVEFASNAPKGSVGAGGSPGESVFLKVGGVAMEPKKVIDGDYYRMNIEKGNQAQSGEHMTVIGDISVSATTTEYTEILRDNSSMNTPLIVKSNSHGELWLVVGTDSGFEGVTTLYYTHINAILSRSN